MVTKDPDRTRQTILDAGFQEIHRSGFRAARVDRILADTHLTKGAFYHHFPSKDALGHAIVDEVIPAKLDEMWLEPLLGHPDPLSGIPEILRTIAGGCRDQLACGCPLNNLAQEMSPVDEGFRIRLHRALERFREGFQHVLEDGQRRGVVRADADARAASLFILGTVQGALGLAKNARDPSILERFADELGRYLEGLRP